MRVHQLLLSLGLSLSVALGSCAPLILITHSDRAHPTALVYVDGEEAGQLAYGDTFSARVEWGQHHILVLDEATGNCVWAGDEEGWLLWVLDEVELTLLPPLDAHGSSEVKDD